MRWKILLAPALCAAVIQSCGVADDCTPGERGCSCTAQRTCDLGLSCEANVCILHVMQSDAPSAGAPAQPQVGAECTNDVECGTGLRCITAASRELAGGGAAGGYCTSSCTSDAQCQSLDPRAVCASTSAAMLCLRSCFSGDPGDMENKCLDRATLACRALTPPSPDARQRGVCEPRCASDAECSPRFCDLESGLCRDQPASGLAIGEACGSGAQCAGGECLASACSAPCVVGRRNNGCGFGPSAPMREAACLTPATAALGDVGSCLKLCDVAEDCPIPGDICLPAQELGIGRAGFCAPP
jgi:hypothetical protein